MPRTRQTRSPSLFGCSDGARLTWGGSSGSESRSSASVRSRGASAIGGGTLAQSGRWARPSPAFAIRASLGRRAAAHCLPGFRRSLVRTGEPRMATSGVTQVGEDALGAGAAVADSGARERFRGAVATRYGVPASEVVTTLGASGALFVAHATLQGPGRRLLVESPSDAGAARGRGAGRRRGPLRAPLRGGLRPRGGRDCRGRVAPRPPWWPSHQPPQPDGHRRERRDARGAGALATRGITLLIDEAYLELAAPDCAPPGAEHRHVLQRHQVLGRRVDPCGVAPLARGSGGGGKSRRALHAGHGAADHLGLGRAGGHRRRSVARARACCRPASASWWTRSWHGTRAWNGCRRPRAACSAGCATRVAPTCCRRLSAASASWRDYRAGAGSSASPARFAWAGPAS